MPPEDQKPQYLQQVQAVTANIQNKKKKKNIQNSLQHTITVKNYIHTVLPKKVPEDKYTYQQGAQTPQSSHKYSAC